ncbi:MAG: hypothetical protein EHM55_00370 [Acidobacteria bacterium]|nr:MAG: hypothetical protein EHM55_00370 [Acidobacteriota bacterium]
MANTIRSNVRTATTWSIVLSILMMIAGVLAILSPAVAGLAITVVVGWLLVFSGLFHIAFAWQADRAGSVVWEIVMGLLYGAIGFYLLAHPAVGLASLSLAIALYLAIEGALELMLAYQFRGSSGNGWLMADGILTLLLAVMIASTWPSNAVWAVGTIVGISMFFSGMSRLMLSYGVRRVVA